MAIQFARRRFTVEEYHKMGEVGILHEDDRVELIDGEIVELSPINRPHINCVDRLTRLFVRAVGDDVIVRGQSPVYLDEGNEPQPDLAILREPNESEVRMKHQGEPGNILLLIEVSESTVSTDRSRKVPRYARAGVPEVWIVNIPKKVVEVYVEPVDGKYTRIGRVGQGDTVTLTALPGVTLAVSDFLR